MAATSIARPNSGEVIASAWGTQVADAHNGIQSGLATINNVTAGNASLRVTFPRAYIGVPIVVACVNGSSFFFANAGAADATGFTIYVRDIRDAQAGTAATLGINWMAMGVPA